MNQSVSLVGSQFDTIAKQHGTVEAVNRFVEEFGILPSHIAESETARELRDCPDLSQKARALL